MSDISDFPLIWRWTSPIHAMFSAAELAALRPCSLVAAARIHDESRAFDQRDSLDPQHFQCIREHSADVSTREGCSWLRAQAPDLSEQVTVSWDREVALRVPWEFFTAQWDDFCYPSSDDVLIIPDGREWALRYHHSEIFYFGARMRTGTTKNG
jgi:hypothetical protein